MDELWLSLCASVSQEHLFWALGVAGTSLFVLRLFMMFFGGFMDDAGMDNNQYEFHELHDGASLKLLTIYSLAGFCMMFGWTGLTVLQHYPTHTVFAVVVALVVGFATMLIAAWSQRMIRQLASSGTRFRVAETVGMQATVYQRIVAGTGGKIQVLVDGMTRELVAFSQDGRVIETMTAVVIVKIIDDHTVIVALAQ